MRDSLGRRERPRRIGRRMVVALFLLVLATGAGLVVWAGTSGPQARLREPLHLIGPDATLALELTAGRAGLASFEILLRRPDGTRLLVNEEEIPRTSLLGSGVRRRMIRIPMDARKLGLPEGPGQLEVRATDHAPSSTFAADEPILTIPIVVDRTPPKVRLQHRAPSVRQGGTGLVVYDVDTDAITSGVRIGDKTFFGATPAGFASNQRVALYAVPVDAPAELQPVLTARDAAGNRTDLPFSSRVREKDFHAEEISITKEFVETTIEPLLAANGQPVPKDPMDAFLAVNRDMRATSEERLQQLTRESDPNLAMGTRFRQQPGTQVGSRFAEHRTYIYEGRAIDQQHHLGYDLASVREAPIRAAQTGRVQAVTELGIYGRVVLIDHGMGVSSLYAHLSRTTTEPGDRVEAGQIIGHSGETGLASGDHLHFSILIGGQHVDPLEWWDPRWVELHIEAPLREAARGNPLPHQEAP